MPFLLFAGPAGTGMGDEAGAEADAKKAMGGSSWADMENCRRRRRRCRRTEQVSGGQNASDALFYDNAF